MRRCSSSNEMAKPLWASRHARIVCIPMADYQIGAKREELVQVGNDNAIRFLGPEGPRVLSTPQMILFMERTCRNLILAMLDPGNDTVGTHVNVSHCVAAPMGSTVTFSAELLELKKRRVEFRVQARLGERIIGEGTHQRAIVDVARFAEKVRQGNAG
jgi:fluoroacetyl-CoA thioesterase